MITSTIQLQYFALNSPIHWKITRRFIKHRIRFLANIPQFITFRKVEDLFPYCEMIVGKNTIEGDLGLVEVVLTIDEEPMIGHQGARFNGVQHTLEVVLRGIPKIKCLAQAWRSLGLSCYFIMSIISIVAKKIRSKNSICQISINSLFVLLLYTTLRMPYQ